MSAKDRLQELQAALTKSGIVDSKFYIRRSQATTDASVTEDVIHLMQSFLNKQMVDHEMINDSGVETKNP